MLISILSRIEEGTNLNNDFLFLRDGRTFDTYYNARPRFPLSRPSIGIVPIKKPSKDKMKWVRQEQKIPRRNEASIKAIRTDILYQ